jgi:hypothetical protein
VQTAVVLLKTKGFVNPQSRGPNGFIIYPFELIWYYNFGGLGVVSGLSRRPFKEKNGTDV